MRGHDDIFIDMDRIVYPEDMENMEKIDKDWDRKHRFLRFCWWLSRKWEELFLK